MIRRAARNAAYLFAVSLVALEALLGLILLGTEAAGGGTAIILSAETGGFFQVEATVTGEIAALHVKLNEAPAAAVKLALWSDSANTPGASLAEAEAISATTVFEATLSSEVEVKAGTKYWIAIWGAIQIKIAESSSPTTLYAKVKGGKKAKLSEYKEWAATETLGPVAVWATGSAAGGAARLAMVV